MPTYECVKETYFNLQLFRPGGIYIGDDAPGEYFKQVKAGKEKAPKRMKADGKPIAPDSLETLRQ